MHADAIHSAVHVAPDEGLGRPLLLAIGLHLLLLLVMWASSWFNWTRDSAAGGGGGIEATMETSAAEDRAVQRALRQAPIAMPEPVAPPTPLDEAEEETVPPPQPIPEPAPQDAPTPRQVQAQERVATPDVKDQDEAKREAISQEKARQEQEAKRRQEQIDLSERKRQEAAENQRRLAAEREAEQKKIADAAKLKAEQQKKAEDDKRKANQLAQIRAERAKLDREKQLAEQKLRQLADARARGASSAAAAATGPDVGASSGAGGDSGDADQWLGAVAAAIERQWIRPEGLPSAPCPIRILMLPGGAVRSVEVQPGCPYDAAARDRCAAASRIHTTCWSRKAWTASAL